MKRRARDLSIGDVFRLHVYGEVLAATAVGGGKSTRIRVAIEDQGRRANRGTLGEALRKGTWKPELQFLDEGHVLEFICKPGRKFHVVEGWDDDDDDDNGTDFSPQPSPSKEPEPSENPTTPIDASQGSCRCPQCESGMIDGLVYGPGETFDNVLGEVKENPK
jgi:hypothetical protein